MGIEKIRREELEALIADCEYLRRGTMTICVLTLDTGFKVTGQSACFNPADYDENIGQDIAYQRAFDQLWSLEGYHRLSVHHGATSEEEE